MWNKILYVYGDNFGWLTVTRLGSYVVLQKVKHHKKPNQACGVVLLSIHIYFSPCIWPLYNDSLSNTNSTSDHVLWLNILSITTIRRLAIRPKVRKCFFFNFQKWVLYFVWGYMKPIENMDVSASPENIE